MKKHAVLLLMVTLMVSACSRTPTNAISHRGAILEFQREPTTDLGIVTPSQDPLLVEHQFRNSGDKTLVIESVSPSCTCARAEARPSRVAPGQTGKIMMTLDRKKLGVQSASISIHSNCTKSSITKVQVNWHTRNDISTNPPKYPTTRLVAGSDVDIYVEIDSIESVPHEKDLRVESKMDNNVEGLSHSAYLDGKKCRLKINASNDIKPGLYYGEVVISKKGDEAQLGVTWYVQVEQPISFQPEAVSIIASDDLTKRAQVVINASSSSDMNRLTASVGEDGSESQPIDFEITIIDDHSCVLDFLFSEKQAKTAQYLILGFANGKKIKVPIIRDGI